MTPILENKDSPSAFDGLKVVEFSWYITGPRTARYFADHGATVVKIEGPGRYDGGRDVGPYKEKVVHVDRSGFFTLYNVNKYGISVDLKNPVGIELTKKLIRWSDVVIESFTPGVMKKLGLDYDSAKEINPNIIYASTSMMGQSGPYSLFTGFGTHASCICGFGDITGWPNRMPSCPFWAYTDHIGPQLMASTILTALIARRNTGDGQYIDQAQNESAVHFLAPSLLDYAVNRRIATREGNRNPRAAPHNAYPCKGDDRWCVIAVHEDQDWKSLCKVMGFPEWTKDMKFANLHSRKQNEEELDRLIGEWTIQFSAEILMAKLQNAGIAAGVVQNAEDLQNDPQLKSRNHFLTFNHESNGAFIVDALPTKLSKTPSEQYMPSPSLGEHNYHVCTQFLGLSDEEFVELVADGCFG
jgi:benzylsuccinate CoA-transferase BbsF subunit